MRCCSFYGLLLGLLLGGALHAQRTWTVDLLNRAGTDFTDLPAAVVRVSPGDILRVRYIDPARRLFYTLPTLHRGLSIVGESQRPICMSVMQISSLPAAETILISNLRLGTVDTTLLSNPPSRGALLQNNLGSIFFDDVEYGTDIVPGATDPRGFFLDQCALVTFAHCVLYQCVSYIHFRDSNVVATHTSFLPLVNRVGSSIIGTPVWCERSRVWLVDSEVRGSDQFLSAPEASAISACNSYFWLAGSTAVMPGWPFFSGASFTGPLLFNPWPASCNPWYSEVHINPGVQVSGMPSNFLITTDPVPAIVWSIAQSQLTLRTYGHPSSPTLLAATFDPSPVVSGPLGHLFLDPTAMVVVGVVVTDAQGRHNLNIPVPPGLPPNMHLAVQALQLTPSLNLELTNVTVVSTW